MKKCNFLAVLVTALFMFLGLSANAQYMPSVKAKTVVTNALEDLKKNPPAAAQATHVTPSSAAAFMVYSLKITIGDLMAKPLENGRSVEDALAEAVGQINVGNSTERRQALNEAESFYKDLLKKRF
jgi:hypothetical protein